MKKGKMFDLSMFVLRAVIGIIFAAHGSQKLFGMFGGIGIDGTVKMVEALGFLTSSYLIAVVWGCIEFVGGIFMILGILSRWAAFSIVLTIIIQLWKINLSYGFFIQNSGIEHNLLIIAACIPIVLLGGGNWSVWDA
ncbi:MAG: DoxX family protein [Candidatus Omnitrophota bacterium]